MSVLPEYIIQQAIHNGFRQLRKDPRLLDSLFKNLTQTQLEAVKKFITESKIDFNINFPRKDLSLPSIVLILKNENESNAFLGDMLGYSSRSDVPEQDHTVDTLGGHGASTSPSSGLPRKVKGSIGISSQEGDSSLLFDDDLTEFVENLYENPVGCLQLYVIKGSGAGQVKTVLRITPDGLDIEGAFDVNLDNTSVIDLRVPDDPALAEGEPSRVFLSDSSIYRRGVHYDVSYQLHVLASKQEHVIFLFYVVKGLLLSQRKFLESQGIQVLTIGGSDFAPRSDFLPTEAFQRMLNLRFTYLFSFMEELDEPDQIAVDLLPKPFEGDSSEAIILGFPITLD